MSETKVEYIKDKETKGTFRFKPANEDIIGNATIYLPKDFIKDVKIDTERGFTITIAPK